MKYDVDGLIIRINIAKKRTNEILSRSIIITQLETEREEKKKKLEQNIMRCRII